jgi:phthiocerol/phenolphthiocerol synthesis type-I polyketide synthase C
MTGLAERAAQLSPQAREVLARELIRAGTTFPIDEVAEPVAVVGIGCRLPGEVVGPESFWRLLVNGEDAITEVPADRWDAEAFYDPDPLAPGRMTTKWGGFLSDVAGFDADFFGITPREAAAMDPQQRVLLEVAWEALEHAGIVPDSLDGTRTGVMMGLCSWDYTLINLEANAEIDAYSGTGNPHSTAVGRISYLLGLQGPSVAVDTACSSSLVAIHLACQSLRLRESDIALAGGVQLCLSAFTSIALSKWSALSSRGRCSSFDAAADGFVRGEGAGVVVLKRLSDAVRDKDRILAVVRGSAVNQDGRSNGLTAPNVLAQRAVITDALRVASIAADTIGYVEAHGTGTVLGDPIEFEALATTYGRGDNPCGLGAVKSNLGHLEAAAGIAGFIKAVLSLQHGQIPPNLNFTRWNPAIDPATTRLFIPTENTPWSDIPGPRRAGVSSFGIGGTNAHVVLEQGPEPVPVVVELPSGVVSTLVVAAKSAERVASAAGVLGGWLQTDGAGVSLAGVAHTLDHHRARHGVFGTVCARDHAQAVAGLAALAAGRAGDGVVGPHEGVCRPGTVFVYSGQGSQWAGMGRRLLADEPAFAAAVAELEPVFVEQVGFSLQQVLADGEALVGIDRIQPVLVGMQLALTELWRSYGVAPDAVIGHSMGEVTAAVVAGALSPAEGLKVIATRSKLMARLSGQGAMALLELDPQGAEALIAGYPGVTLAVYASPRQSVIAGPPEQVDAVVAVVAGQDRLARRIEVDVASHHPIIDPVLPELRSALAGLAPQPPDIPVVSTVGEFSSGAAVFGADYWAANLRNPVRFSDAVAAAGAEYGTFVEVSPHPLLTYAIGDTLAREHHHSVSTLQRDGDDTLVFHTSVNSTFTTVPPVSEHGAEPHPVLPATPWQHSRFWISASSSAAAPVVGHPLLGVGVTDPINGTRVWERTLGADFLWLGDHCVDDVCVLPGAVFAELVLAAVTEAFGADDDRPWVIAELCLHQVLPIGDATVVVTTLSGDESRPCVEIRSGGVDLGWTLHAGATLRRGVRSVGEPFEVGQGSAGPAVAAEDLYGRLRGAGQQHGPAFQGIEQLEVLPSGAVRARVRLPSEAKAGSGRFVVHPVMVDVALQALGATGLATDLAAGSGDAGSVVVLPVRLAGVRVYGDVTQGVWVVASLAPTADPDRFVGRVQLSGAQGEVVLDVDEVDMVVLRAGGVGDEVAGHLFTVEWAPVELEPAAARLGAVLLVGVGDVDEPVFDRLRSGLLGHAGHVEVVWAAERGRLREALTRKDVAWDAVAVVCPPRSVDEALAAGAQLELAQSRVLLIAEIVKTLSQVGSRNSPRLWIVTRGAQQVDVDESVTLAQTTLRGIGRVLTFEHSEVRPTLVDVEAEGLGWVQGLVEELIAGAGHDEVALRGGRRYVNRLVRVATSAGGELAVQPRPVRVDLGAGGGVRLQVDQPGLLDALSVHALKRVPVGEGQVEVRVAAAGLNFSDVLKAMGLYPTLDGSAAVIGSECVGYVTALGAGVDSVAVGQRVIAFGPGSFGSHVTTSADLVVPVPQGLSDVEAAAVGIAYLTAWYALCEVGRLAPGERVLIHSATGGVGLAAISIAKSVGARIYTTAGSPAKREMLAGLGVEYVGDSRGVDFAQEIVAATDGAGVDVVLNSLAGEAIRRGVEILAPGGRFVELGKRDVYADAQLGLAALAKSGSFAVVDLDLNMRLAPQRYRRMLEDILGQVVAGRLQRLPVTEFELDNAVEAFRLMASGGHIGKIVVSIPAQGVMSAVASAPAAPLVRGDGGYIVIGGMGGLGFVVAKWLVEQGAGLVVLNGRSAPGEQVAGAIAELNAAGPRVQVITGDIAQPGTAGRLVAAVTAAGLRPAGVLHSATVLVDEIVLNISSPAAAQVFAPKVAGHWWLHEATKDLDLDWWLTFSSAASLLGSPGQGSYAAANSWVDGLVAYRRAQGLPAVGINWGPWAEVGRAQFFADLGFSMITSELGLAAMQQVLAADRARTGVFSLDARQWFQSFPAAQGSSLFAELGKSVTTERRGGGRVRAELDAAAPADRPGLLAEAIATEIQAVRRSTDPLDHNAAMESLGLDSLMALELRNRLEATLGITLPVALVWAHPSIATLADALCERMGYEPEPEAALSEEEMNLLANLVQATELAANSGAADS